MWNISHASSMPRLMASSLSPLPRASLRSSPRESQAAGEVSAGRAAARTWQEHLDAHAAAGHGRLLLRARLKGDGVVVTSEAPEGRPHDCHFTLGYLRRAAARLSGTADATGAEIECRQRGDDQCRFFVQPR